MSTSLVTSLKLLLAATLTSTNDLGNAAQPLNYNKVLSLADGTGANQARQLFSDQRALAASASENLDLAGSLTDAFGNLLALTKVKALVIIASAANTNDVLVGGHATAAASSFFGDATDVVKVKPGGMFVLTAPDANGYAITATTADLLKIANSGAGTGVTYDIILIGV